MSKTPSSYTAFNLPSPTGTGTVSNPTATLGTLDSIILKNLSSAAAFDNTSSTNPSAILPNKTLDNLTSLLNSGLAVPTVSQLKGIVSNIQTPSGTPSSSITSIQNTLNSTTLNTNGTPNNLTSSDITSMLGQLSPTAPPTVSSGVPPTSIEEPTPTSNQAIYGKVQVVGQQNSLQGLVIDETPGNERIIYQHKTGSYNTIWADGSQTEKITNNEQSFITKDSTKVVGNDLTEIIKHNHKVNINNNENILVSSDKSDTINGNYIINVGSNLQIIVGSNGTIQISGNGSIQCSGNINLTASGTVSIQGSSISLN